MGPVRLRMNAGPLGDELSTAGGDFSLDVNNLVEKPRKISEIGAGCVDSAMRASESGERPGDECLRTNLRTGDTRRLDGDDSDLCSGSVSDGL